MQSKNSQQTKVQGQMTRWLHKGIPLHINKNNNNNNNKNKNKKNLNIYASQTISKKLYRMKYFQTCATKPASPSYQNQTKTI